MFEVAVLVELKADGQPKRTKGGDMEACREVLMESSSVLYLMRQGLSRISDFMRKALRRREKAANRKRLAALSPWLKKDLGVGFDGKPLDQEKKG